MREASDDKGLFIFANLFGPERGPQSPVARHAESESGVRTRGLCGWWRFYAVVTELSMFVGHLFAR